MAMPVSLLMSEGDSQAKRVVAVDTFTGGWALPGQLREQAVQRASAPGVTHPLTSTAPRARARQSAFSLGTGAGRGARRAPRRLASAARIIGRPPRHARVVSSSRPRLLKRWPAAQCPGKSHPEVVDMPTLSRSMFRVGRVASDLLIRRLSLPPALARRDATPTVMTSKSAHADRLSRSVHPPFVSGFRSNDFLLWVPTKSLSLSLGNFFCQFTPNKRSPPT
jgi:hypothetical protein